MQNTPEFGAPRASDNMTTMELRNARTPFTLEVTLDKLRYYLKATGSTPIPRTVLKHSQTSHLAEQPFFSFEDYGIAQYSQINPLWQNPRLGNAFGLSVLF